MDENQLRQEEIPVEVRASAMTVFIHSPALNEIVELRNKVLQDMTKALLEAFIIYSQRQPSPEEFQQMCELTLDVWDDVSSSRIWLGLRQPSKYGEWHQPQSKRSVPHGFAPKEQTSVTQ